MCPIPVAVPCTLPLGLATSPVHLRSMFVQETSLGTVPERITIYRAGRERSDPGSGSRASASAFLLHAVATPQMPKRHQTRTPVRIELAARRELLEKGFGTLLSRSLVGFQVLTPGANVTALKDVGAQQLTKAPSRNGVKAVLESTKC